ncbi:MAG TPA: hypothetical protein VGW38_04380, partial [Chloroflexota bacterium]|nr:hypothetical protein [Chloroflexota bacterium]
METVVGSIAPLRTPMQVSDAGSLPRSFDGLPAAPLPGAAYPLQRLERAWALLSQAVSAWRAGDVRRSDSALRSAARAALGSLEHGLTLYLEVACRARMTDEDVTKLRAPEFGDLVGLMRRYASPAFDNATVTHLSEARVQLLEVTARAGSTPPTGVVAEALRCLQAVITTYVPDGHEALSVPAIDFTGIEVRRPSGVVGAWLWLRDAWVHGSWARTAAAVGVLWAAAFVFLAPSLVFGFVYWQGDTLSYYLPVHLVYAAALSRGELPFWTPHMAGGYPLLADGEGGMLYPVNVLLTWLLSPGAAYHWQLFVRFGLAGTFAFWFARELKLDRAPSFIGGVVFAFSSFMVGQLHHSNVGNSALWLPAVLACAERASRTCLPWKVGWVSLGGLTFGTAMLGLHVQPILMTGMVLALWCGFRAVPHLIAAVRPHAITAAQDSAAEAPTQGRWSRLQTGISDLSIVPAITFLAMGVAAAQLFPLYELVQFSSRGAGMSYQLANNFSLNPFDLTTLLFPSFFRGIDDQWWSLWFKWETTLYVGIVPLGLAVASVFLGRGRERWFFVGLAVLSLLLALGDHSPVKLYRLMWEVPGLSALRAPGRFTYLFVFACAMLAAFGMQGALSCARSEQSVTTSRINVAVRLQAMALLLGAVLSGLLVALVLLRRRLQDDPASVVELIQNVYLTLPRDYAYQASAEYIAASLAQSLDLTNPRTALALVLLASIATWFAAVSFRGSRHPHWQVVPAVLVAGELLFFALTFHQVAPLTQVTRPIGPAQFLVEHEGLHRHLSRGAPAPGVEPNRLLPFHRSDADGYSSLPLARAAEYLHRLKEHDGALMDLMGVRYLISYKDRSRWPAHERVHYNVDRPLLHGPSAGPESTIVLNAGAFAASELRLIGSLTHARHLPQGAEVATVEVRDTRGRTRRFPLRAGQDIADEGLQLPATVPANHQAARVAYTRFGRTAEGNVVETLGYFTRLPFDGDLMVDKVTVAFTYPEGQIHLAGAGLMGTDGTVRQLTLLAKHRPGSASHEKFRP